MNRFPRRATDATDRNGRAKEVLELPPLNGTEPDKPVLTPKQRRFVAEYVANPNATQAYLRAFPGSTYHTARNEAAKLLANPCIREEIDTAREALEERTQVQAAEVIQAAARIMRADPLDLFEYTADGAQVLRQMRDIPPHLRRTISSFKVKRGGRKRVKNGKATIVETAEMVDVKLNDRMAAIEVLMKMLGLVDRAQPEQATSIDEVRERLAQHGIDFDELSRRPRQIEARTAKS